jgi:hypothetical protein
MRLSIRSLAAYAAILALSLILPIAAGVAMGQEGTAIPANPGSAAAPGAVSAQKVDDATLKQTAKAYVHVRRIMEKAQQDMSSAGDDARKEQISAQLEARKVAAVKAEGLQPQEYNHVIQLVQVDNTLQQKFLSYVDQANGSPTTAE